MNYTIKLLTKASNMLVGKAQAKPKAERTRQYVSILAWFATPHTGILEALVSNLKELELISVGTNNHLRIIGNYDIVCYHTNDGNIENLEKTIVVDTFVDEMYPDVRSFDDDNFFSTFVKNNNIFGPLSYDGGLNWVEVDWQINENNGCVLEEYKTSDLCEGGVLAFWEESCGEDIDLSMGNTLFDNPPKTPSKPIGPISGFMCLSYEYFSYSYGPDFDNFKCQHELYNLFGTSIDQWTVPEAKLFISSVIQFWNDW